MRIRPLGYHVLVEVSETEQVSDGGIVLNTPAQQKLEEGRQDTGIVVAIGPTAHLGYEGCTAETAEGRAEQWGYKVGDKVQYRSFEGKMYNDENQRVVVDSQLIAVLED